MESNILQEQHSKRPDLPVLTSGQPLLEVPWLSSRIIAIFVDATNDECDFVAVDEAIVLLVDRAVREVDKEGVAEECSSHCHEAKDEEDPSPPF